MDKKTKALVLFSGGLDSMLAVKVLKNQGIDTTAVCFYSNFFNCVQAEKSAKEIGVPLIMIDISADMIELVKNPPSGHGKHLNPCIDCHALMMRKAGGVPGFDFLATGEVLGQRPFSQNKQALARVLKLAGVEILRPLSAKLLEETEMERSGMVDREKLLAISGRSRSAQLELAKQFGIDHFPSPAGGCLLTQSEYSSRLKTMLDNWAGADPHDIELLKNGRVFWVKTQIKRMKTCKTNETNDKALIVVGRNKAENEQLERLAQKGDFMLQLKEINGPTAIIRSIEESELERFDKQYKIPEEIDLLVSEAKSRQYAAGEIMNFAAIMTGYYSTQARSKTVKITGLVI
jgi:tRNA-uridine 2-sulfurtransferase